MSADRAARVAAVHAAADWLADHPEVPFTTVLISYHVSAADEVDEATRVAGVLSVLRPLDPDLIEGEHTVQGDVDLTTNESHGILITYRAAAFKDVLKTRGRRYVQERTAP